MKTLEVVFIFVYKYLSILGPRRSNIVGLWGVKGGSTLLNKFWRISLYLTYAAIAKLYVT